MDLLSPFLRVLMYTGVVVFGLTIVILDHVYPHSLPAFVFYPILALAGLWMRPLSASLLIALAATFLSTLGAINADHHGLPFDQQFLRAAMVVALWVTAVIIFFRKKEEDAWTRIALQHTLILESAGEGIYGIDRDGYTTFANPMAAKMVGRTAEEMVGELQHELIHHTRPDGSPYPKKECRIYAAMKENTTTHVDDEVFWRKDGGSFPVRYTARPLHDAHGQVSGAVVVFNDISEQYEADLKSRQLAAIVESSDDAIMGSDVTGRITTWNRGAERIYGYTAEEVLGQHHSIIAPHRQDEVDGLVTQVKNGQPVEHFETTRRRKDGTDIKVSITASTITDNDGKIIGFSAIARDITQRKQAEAELRRLATTDPLTGLCNRRHFFSKSRSEHVRAQRYRKPFAIALIDLDHFKAINDLNGHEAGDLTLTTVARTLLQAARELDLVCRFGGEEFAVLLPETDSEGARAAGERLRAAIASSAARYKNHDIRVTASIGIAVFGQAGNDIETMIRAADRALYSAKKKGRNRVEIGGDSGGAIRPVSPAKSR